ncbi:hypothetical protein D9M71_844410 [compost metagenome]
MKIYGFFKWMMQDYAHVPAHVIEEESARLALEGEDVHASAVVDEAVRKASQVSPVAAQ